MWGISKGTLLILCIIAMLGGYLRVVAVTGTVLDRPIRADAAEYYISAYNLAKHGIYSRSHVALRNAQEMPSPDAYRWPGLPLVIAAFMGYWPDHAGILRKIQWLNVATGTTAVLLIGLAAAMTLPPWAAIAAAGLTAISPHLVSFGVYMLTEPPAVFLVALLLLLCAVGSHNMLGERCKFAAALGVVAGLIALFRPVFFLFAFAMAFAFLVFKNRKMLIVALLIGASMPVTPWLVRNAISVARTSEPSLAAGALIAGAYPGYVFNGDPRTFPYPYEYDPAAKTAAITVSSALAEIGRRITAEPARMAKWYLLEKMRYLWQFDNIDGIGGVFIYPVRQTPFQSDLLFRATHGLMRLLHWPIVVLAAVGCVLVWLPRSQEYVPERSRLMLRTGSLLLLFVTAVHVPVWVSTRLAVPIFSAMFIVATVPVLAIGPVLRRLRKA